MNVKKRGFGSMSAEKRSEIAQKGGQAAHAKGTAHRWTREAAQAAALKSAAARKKPDVAPTETSEA